MKVMVTDAAWHDMLAIARDRQANAERFLEELYDACTEIGDFPLACPLLPDHMDSGMRRKLHGRFLIFYRATPDRVEILHVLHGARDYEAILFPEE